MPYLDNLAQHIRQINENNGWNITTPEDWGNPYKFPAIIALIHSEASEALEGFRKDDFENFMEEMADVVIRVLDCVGCFEDCSFDKVIADKLEANKKRGYRHGGKKV